MDKTNQTNFFRSFRFDFHDQDRVVMEISETKNSEKHEKVIPVDFSLSGLALISRNKFEIGADVLLKIKFKKNQYEIHGTIVRGKWIERNDAYHFGIQFQEQSQADILSLMDRYLVSLSKSRLKANLLTALKNSSGRFHQKPNLDEMIIYLLNTFHLQGGAEDIIPKAIEYARQIGLFDGNFKLNHSTPAETKYSLRLSDLFDQPHFDLFVESSEGHSILLELTRILFTTKHQRFVGFSDPKKSREFALIGQSPLIKNFRSNLLEIMESPCIVVLTGAKGTGKTHFSNVIREELRKKNHRSHLMNPLTDIDCFRELLSGEDREEQVLIVDNLNEVRPEILQKVVELSQKNWVVINSRKKLELPISGRIYQFQLSDLNRRREDIAHLCHYYLRRRHSLNITLEEDFLKSFETKNYERNLWQLFEMLDTFVFHIMMRETLDWPSHEVYPEFDHHEHQLYQSLSKTINASLSEGKNKEQIIENCFAKYLFEYVEIHGTESLEEEHREFYEYLVRKSA
jgi:hypothetical protein